jgi:hypothetical protein
MLYLMDELQVGRHAGAEIEAELYRRNSRWRSDPSVSFI